MKNSTLLKKITLAFLLSALFSIPALAQKTPKVDFAKKISEATPPELPQTPVAEKLKSDARNENLKGKVKSVTTDWQVDSKSKRQRSTEEYYNQQGNLVKQVLYIEGYPENVYVWGYLDGKRVENVGDIKYAKGERPEEAGTSITAIGIVRSKPTAERDTRYIRSYKYKYDEKGRLVEEWMYENNGELSGRTTYSYKGNKRETVRYDHEDKYSWREVEVLDKNGNVIEESSYGEDRELEGVKTYTYQFDSRGNWIVQKSFDKETVNGKTVLYPTWITYRKIDYYP